MSPDRIADRVRSRLPDVLVARGEVTVTTSGQDLLDTLTMLRDDPELRFDWLSDVSCTDWPGREPRIWMAYHLASTELHHRLRVKVGLPGHDPRLPTASALHPTAEWQEREVYDMFGVVFDGHPDLRRVLMPDDWEGFPLRKDHPLGGVPTQYKGASVPPPDERGL